MDASSNILDSAYKIRNANITSEVFDKEMVVLDLESGFYFSLNETASEIWQHIVNHQSAISLEDDVIGLAPFVNQLLEYNLIVPCETSLEASAPLKISNPSEQPSMDVFDDLSDLFMADPIHDVDIDKGWPYTKPD
jgi:hypothetical protein